MAALGTATVTPQKNTRRIDPRNVRSHMVNITFGDGVSTYPTGGVVLPNGQGFGFPRGHLELVDIIDSNTNNYAANVTWDSVNNKLRMVHTTQQTGASGNRDGVEYANTDVPASGINLVAQVWGF